MSTPVMTSAVMTTSMMASPMVLFPVMVLTTFVRVTSVVLPMSSIPSRVAMGIGTPGAFKARSGTGTST